MLNELVHSAKYLQRSRLDRGTAKAFDVADTVAASRSLRTTVGRGLIALGRRLTETGTVDLPEKRAA
ncbi:MAG: hypothetical protein ACE5F5_05625 [Acidimicrobiia bacterium]